MGTEPFWDIYLTEDYLVHNDLTDNSFYTYKLMNQFDNTIDIQLIQFQDEAGENFELKIEKEEFLDVAGRAYPYTVRWNKEGYPLVGMGSE